MRVRSGKECRGGGWLHRLDGRGRAAAGAITEYLDKTHGDRLSLEQLEAMAGEFFAHQRAELRRAELARSLGVFIWALERLRVGYGEDRRGGFWSFPSKDENGRVVGITRRYEDGAKLSLRGGGTGLFYEEHWYDNDGPVYVVEGGSDVAACISDGVCAIGRPSNVGGAERIAAILKGRKWRRGVVVVAERDEKPEKRGVAPGCDSSCRCCAQCWPGLHGARTVAGQLSKLGVRALVRLPPAGVKDVRELYNRYELDDWTHE